MLIESINRPVIQYGQIAELQLHCMTHFVFKQMQYALYVLMNDLDSDLLTESTG